jgi:hypothetical protein
MLLAKLSLLGRAHLRCGARVRDGSRLLVRPPAFRPWLVESECRLHCCFKASKRCGNVSECDSCTIRNPSASACRMMAERPPLKYGARASMLCARREGMRAATCTISSLCSLLMLQLLKRGIARRPDFFSTIKHKLLPCYAISL